MEGGGWLSVVMILGVMALGGFNRSKMASSTQGPLEEGRNEM